MASGGTALAAVVYVAPRPPSPAATLLAAVTTRFGISRMFEALSPAAVPEVAGFASHQTRYRKSGTATTQSRCHPRPRLCRRTTVAAPAASASPVEKLASESVSNP